MVGLLELRLVEVEMVALVEVELGQEIMHKVELAHKQRQVKPILDQVAEAVMALQYGVGLFQDNLADQDS